MFTYAYNNGGLATQVTYPSQRVVTTAYDGMGRAKGLSGNLGGTVTNYAGTATGQDITYWAHGPVYQMKLGNTVLEEHRFNDRLQPTEISAKYQGATWLGLSYRYCAGEASACASNTGNVVSQRIVRLTNNWFQEYGYDRQNRLKMAKESGNGVWQEGYVFDSYGNRALCMPQTNPAQTCSMARAGLPDISLETARTTDNTVENWYNATNNRLNEWTYDEAGNIKQVGSMARTFTYDAEGRQLTAVAAGLTNTYTYDGEGRRVTRTTPWNTTTQTTVYVYDAFGQLAVEYGQSTETGTKYLTADVLGSTRLISPLNPVATTGSGQTANVTNLDYRPFGEELGAGIGGRDATFPAGAYPSAPNGTSERFTGKERDAETGLDYFGARYMSSAQGRFTSADPDNAGSELETPQSWNMYGYALNNPMKYVDPDGESPTLATAAAGAGIGFAVGAGGEIFSQWRAGKGYNWQKIGAKGAGSAVFGFGIGLTGGASLLVTAGVGATGSLAGGVVERAVDGDESTEAFDEADLASDVASGLIGGAAAHQIQALLRARLPLPEWAKIQLRQANRLRRIAKVRVDARPASSATLNQTATGTEKRIENMFFVWPSSAARGASKKATREVVKSTIRYLTREEEQKLLPQQ